MARPQQYDRNDVTNRAMHLFWHKGYYTTPVSEIIKTTGLRAGSLYAAYGSKEGLLLATLRQYTDQMELVFSKQLLGSESARIGLENLLLSFVENARCRQPGDGCLLINTMIEVAGHQPHLCDFVNAQLERMLDCFRRGLEKAQEEGDIDPAADIESMATFVMGILWSMATMSRLAPEPEKMQALAQPALHLLFGSR